MKKIFMRFARISLFCWVWLSYAHASPAGKIQLADLSAFYGAPKVEVNLDKTLLSMVTAFSHGEDPELSQMLNKIEEVSVRVYNLDKGADKALQAFHSLNSSLRGKQWQPIVSVNDKSEKISILAKTTNGNMDGLVVMVVGAQAVDNEAVFINIVGEIDPAQLSKVTKALKVNYGAQKNN